MTSIIEDIKRFTESMGWGVLYLMYAITRRAVTDETISQDEFMIAQGFRVESKHWWGTTYSRERIER